MSKLNSEITAYLNEANIWILVTSGDKPNATRIGTKKIDANGNLVFFDIFMKKSIENISKNPNVSVLALADRQSYQLKGTAVYSTDEALLKEGNEMTSKMNLKTKGAVVVTVNEIYLQTPGADVGKLL